MIVYNVDMLTTNNFKRMSISKHVNNEWLQLIKLDDMFMKFQIQLAGEDHNVESTCSVKLECRADLTQLSGLTTLSVDLQDQAIK